MTDRSSTAAKRGFRPHGLGEIAIRCADMAAMVTFYEDVIGLERMAGDSDSAIVFFRISEGIAGHTNVLALFRHNVPSPRPGLHPEADEPPATGARSSLHHIALSLPFSEQDAAIAWYEKIKQPYRIEHFGWVGWRGVFTQDPEGNTVELVAHHPDLQE